MILIINIAQERLHSFEFVKPIEDILIKNKISYFTKNYLDLNEKDLKKSEKIIICGTSLKDNEFIKEIDQFEWIKYINKPILGICAGMQLIGKLFNGTLKQEKEIGYYFEEFKKEFLGLNGKQEVYHLHNNYIDFENLKDFEIFCMSNKISQAVKHKKQEIYGVLFHPEVRQKELIMTFIKGK